MNGRPFDTIATADQDQDFPHAERRREATLSMLGSEATLLGSKFQSDWRALFSHFSNL